MGGYEAAEGGNGNCGEKNSSKYGAKKGCCPSDALLQQPD